MPPNCPRAARPLNGKAVAEADKDLYTAHEKDPRPNALFDAAGRKKTLSATDPSQEYLRDEWMRNYSKAGGKLDQPKPTIGSPPGTAKTDCPCSKATLTVEVVYDPIKAPVKDAEVTIKGPVTQTIKTDATGIAKFVHLPPGSYTVNSHYVGMNKLVGKAKSLVGSGDWDYDKARTPFPKNTNKCNLFVYETAKAAGYAIPDKPHERKLLGITVSTVMLPPNAVDWASPSSSLITYPLTNTPEPGDVVAWSHSDWSDATGHVGIVSYPKDSLSQSKNLAAGDDASMTLTMRRQSISADHHKVVESPHLFWHFYDEGNTEETNLTVFRRLAP